MHASSRAVSEPQRSIAEVQLQSADALRRSRLLPSFRSFGAHRLPSFLHARFRPRPAGRSQRQKRMIQASAQILPGNLIEHEETHSSSGVTETGAAPAAMGMSVAAPRGPLTYFGEWTMSELRTDHLSFAETLTQAIASLSPTFTPAISVAVVGGMAAIASW